MVVTSWQVSMVISLVTELVIAKHLEFTFRLVVQAFDSKFVINWATSVKVSISCLVSSVTINSNFMVKLVDSMVRLIDFTISPTDSMALSTDSPVTDSMVWLAVSVCSDSLVLPVHLCVAVQLVTVPVCTGCVWATCWVLTAAVDQCVVVAEGCG